MKPGLVIAASLISVVVWTFAVIGILSVADTIAGDEASTRASPASLLSSAAGPDGPVITLAEYPGASRTDYRQEVRGDLLVTNAEYVVEADGASVRSHYRHIFARDGWEVADPDVVRGEWAYVVTTGQRRATIGIEVEGRFAAIAIEITEPAGRGRLSDR